MANVARIEPHEYQALVRAFREVGAPVWAQVCKIVDKERRAAGIGTNLDPRTAKRAWERGWKEQTNGQPAPPISTLIKLPKPIQEEGAASAAAASELEPPHAGVRQETVTPAETATVEVVAGDETELGRVMAAIDASHGRAMLDEIGSLRVLRSNASGLAQLLNRVLAKLFARTEASLERHIRDLETSDVLTISTFRDTMLSLTRMQKEIVASFEAIQKAQRLLAGDPQEIHEHRRNGEAGGTTSEADRERRVKALIEQRMLGTSQNTTGYQMESAQIVDAVVTPVEQPKALDAGEAVAKSDAAADNAA